MKLLLDTQLLLWTAATSTRLSATAKKLICDPRNTLVFSTASIWEVAIKFTLGRSFNVDPAVLRLHLLANDYTELPISSEHAIATTRLPRLHGDPFDRILLAQACVESALLITADALLAKYKGQVKRV